MTTEGTGRIRAVLARVQNTAELLRQYESAEELNFQLALEQGYLADIEKTHAEVLRLEEAHTDAVGDVLRLIDMMTAPQHPKYFTFFQFTSEASHMMPGIPLLRDYLILRYRLVELLSWPEIRHRMNQEGYPSPCIEWVRRWFRRAMARVDAMEDIVRPPLNGYPAGAMTGEGVETDRNRRR